MTEIHKTARDGFSAEAEAYERGRPDYPDAAVAALIAGLGLRKNKTIVDIGAGTGKLTARLVPVSNVVAIEPVAAMRAVLARRLPNIAILGGSAENIPLADGSADAISVAQAFHWFDGRVALHEMHRVLGPGGRLGLIWNARDTSVPWMRTLMELILPYGRGTPSYRSGHWKDAFDHQTLFTLVSHAQFSHHEVRSLDDVLKQVASISYIATLEETARQAVLEEVSSKLRACHGDAEVMVPYQTGLWIYLRR